MGTLLSLSHPPPHGNPISISISLFTPTKISMSLYYPLLGPYGDPHVVLTAPQPHRDPYMALYPFSPLGSYRDSPIAVPPAPPWGPHRDSYITLLHWDPMRTPPHPIWTPMHPLYGPVPLFPVRILWGFSHCRPPPPPHGDPTGIPISLCSTGTLWGPPRDADPQPSPHRDPHAPPI